MSKNFLGQETSTFIGKQQETTGGEIKRNKKKWWKKEMREKGRIRFLGIGWDGMDGEEEAGKDTE